MGWSPVVIHPYPDHSLISSPRWRQLNDLEKNSLRFSRSWRAITGARSFSTPAGICWRGSFERKECAEAEGESLAACVALAEANSFNPPPLPSVPLHALLGHVPSLAWPSGRTAAPPILHPGRVSSNFISKWERTRATWRPRSIWPAKASATLRPTSSNRAPSSPFLPSPKPLICKNIISSHLPTRFEPGLSPFGRGRGREIVVQPSPSEASLSPHRRKFMTSLIFIL